MAIRFEIPILIGLVACTDAPETPDFDGTYTFEGRTGEPSVDIAGQVFRQILIDDLADRAGGFTARADSGWYPDADEVRGELLFYFEFDSATGGGLDHGFSGAVQATYDDISSGKNLVEKLAGNDSVGQHEDWTTAFTGHSVEGVATPEDLVRHWFDELADNTVDYANGNGTLDPDGVAVTRVGVTADGRDLPQLLEKFLRGAVAFSQGTDDYLDDDEPGKGLLADHGNLEDGKPFSALEHAWDEGFGYFGAARTYGDWSDQVIADDGAVDDDGDGAFDLLTEVSLGHSRNAGKRDLGAVVATDFSNDAFDAFVAGRQLIASTELPLTDAELTQLQGHRDTAVLAWEQAISATVVHYINDVLADMSAFGTQDYDFAGHAKHFSELKGFALALQFNPRSPLSDSDFGTLHGLIGDSPALADDPDAATYADDLRAAKALLGTAFGFDPANLGGDDGANGW